MYFFLGTHCGGRRCALPLHPPTRFYFNRFPLLPTILFAFHKHRLFGFILSSLISIEICAYVLLSWYALRGEALRPPPCTPPFFHQLPLLPTLFLFFRKHRLFGFIFSYNQYVHSCCCYCYCYYYCYYCYYYYCYYYYY